MQLRTVTATRYVTPLREGGSLPAIVEADDLGLYVVKFRGAGQGVLALTADLIGCELARALGLLVPDVVCVDVDPALGRNEPDYEIRELLQKSTGINLGIDYLPGSFMFDAAARLFPDAAAAADIVWLDAFITNVDRTARNPNLLWWHRKLYCIDHGAALYFHYNWTGFGAIHEAALSPFAPIRQHVLLPHASSIVDAAARLTPRINPDVLTGILDAVPDEWLLPEPDAPTPQEKRALYVEFFLRRLESASIFTEEAERARTQLI
ncbi:MAG: HipA family kinase [Bryobacteraceae bacterium]|nr:HipA family kinase [Bryobacteraceae bacterium]